MDATSPNSPLPPAPPQSPPPKWAVVVGACFLGLAVVFFMGLVIASLFGFIVPDSSRSLVCFVLALCTSMGGGFLGGSAVASGQLPLPKTPNVSISFGVVGGIAIFVIVLVLCHIFYKEPSITVSVPTISDVITSEGAQGRTNISISFKLDSLPPQHKLLVEIADDAGFKHLVRPRFPIDDFTTGQAVLSIQKSQSTKYWARLVVESADGRIVSTSDPWPFSIA